MYVQCTSEKKHVREDTEPWKKEFRIVNNEVPRIENEVPRIENEEYISEEIPEEEEIQIGGTVGEWMPVIPKLGCEYASSEVKTSCIQNTEKAFVFAKRTKRRTNDDYDDVDSETLKLFKTENPGVAQRTQSKFAESLLPNASEISTLSSAPIFRKRRPKNAL